MASGPGFSSVADPALAVGPMNERTFRQSELDLTADLNGFFEELLHEVVTVHGFETSDMCASYLVGLLIGFARPDPATRAPLERPLTLLLVEAQNSVGGERFERLKNLGDAVLYLSGFFREHLETRGVALGYFTSLGAHAYGQASAMLRTASDQAAAPDVFLELSDNFDEHSCLLNQAADALLARAARANPKSTLWLYERWLKTGSVALSRALALRGLLPQKGSEALH